ncbi:MAG TPA: hypothetical protein ENH82_12025 [bacterium]|nr:hypothetical protein [bacterium]
MKLEVFMDLTTKSESMKPEYASCICSKKVFTWIEMHTEEGNILYGIKLFKERYFPDDRIWMLDEDYTKIYIEKGFSGFIAHVAEISLPPIRR